MPLKVELKPGERVVIGQAVIRNGDQRAKLFIEGDAPILREKDILTPAQADTVAKRIYLSVQLMYLSGSIDRSQTAYFELLRSLLEAAPSALPIVDDLNNCILSGELYKALKAARELIAYEEDLIAHAQSGERLRDHRQADAVLAGA